MQNEWKLPVNWSYALTLFSFLCSTFHICWSRTPCFCVLYRFSFRVCKCCNSCFLFWDENFKKKKLSLLQCQQMVAYSWGQGASEGYTIFCFVLYSFITADMWNWMGCDYDDVLFIQHDDRTILWGNNSIRLCTEPLPIKKTIKSHDHEIAFCCCFWWLYDHLRFLSAQPFFLNFTRIKMEDRPLASLFALDPSCTTVYRTGTTTFDSTVLSNGVERTPIETNINKWESRICIEVLHSIL